VTDPPSARPPAPTARFDAPGQQAATPWQAATVVSIHDETPSARTFRLRLERPVDHLPGQHYVVRLTAEDGYTASRSYSVASAPDGSGEVELTVELLPDGEVSPFLHDVVEPGDVLEVRGPLGRWFTWDVASPALLVGGGSGVVPLMAMLRAARAAGRPDLARLVVSVRTPADLYYAPEMIGPEVTVVHTRVAPGGDPRPAGRLTAADIGPVAPGTTVYLCGSGGFVEHASTLLLAAGVDAADIRVERFGPS
jgi:ferredoxin-NADP reductase